MNIKPIFEIGDIVVVVSNKNSSYYKKIGIVSEWFPDSWEVQYKVRFGLDKDDSHIYIHYDLIKINPQQIEQMRIKE